jgi:hypothetical protein
MLSSKIRHLFSMEAHSQRQSYKRKEPAPAGTGSRVSQGRYPITESLSKLWPETFPLPSHPRWSFCPHIPWRPTAC